MAQHSRMTRVGIRGAILLTGGTGFFGRALLRQRKESQWLLDHSVVVLSRDPERFQAAHPEFANVEGITYHKGNIEDRVSLPWGESFSHVLHAATDSSNGPRLTPLERFRQIHDGTANILDLAVGSGAHRFLLTSSGGIYGPQPADLDAIPEDWHGSPPLGDPGSAYSHAKRSAEHLCSLYRNAYGLETVIARCFAFVGPDLPLNRHFAIGNFIRDCLNDIPVRVNGDGTPLRTYLEQSDLATWLWKLLFEGIAGESYNVGSDEVISIGGLASLVRDLVAPDQPVRILTMHEAKPGRQNYVPSIKKARELHGLKVMVPLREAIIKTAEANRYCP